MQRLRPKKRNSIRVNGGRRLAVMLCVALLSALVTVLTIIARIEMTSIADETLRLERRIGQLGIERREALAEYEERYSLPSIARRAEKMGMFPPSAALRRFSPHESADRTEIYPAYQEQMDKPKKIWEYFG